jgi:hypothetical protein
MDSDYYKTWPVCCKQLLQDPVVEVPQQEQILVGLEPQQKPQEQD